MAETVVLLVVILIGSGIGWFITQVSDYFPRFAVDAITPVSKTVAPPALWQVIQRQPGVWKQLHIVCEIGSAIFVVFLWLRLGLSLLFVLHLVAYIFFTLIAVIDIKYRLVLNAITYPAFVVVLLGQWLYAPDTLLNIVVGGTFAFLIFFGTTLIKSNGLGGGDIKLATLLGLMFGFPGVLYVLLMSAGVTGAFIAAVCVSRRGGLQTQIPYAPFLCCGALAALLLNPLWLESRMLI